MGTLHNLQKGIRKKIAQVTTNVYASAGLSMLAVKMLKHDASTHEKQLSLAGAPFHYIGSQELLHGIKEIFVDQLYLQSIPPGAKILDCGANIGISVRYFQKLNPSVHITAFEPDAKNFELLEKNAAYLGNEQLSLIKAAVFTRNGHIKFAQEGSMSSKISHDSAHQVACIDLADYLNEPVHFLKIDIEGAEFDVLKHIRTKLHSVQSLFIEYHGDFNELTELNQILSWVTEAGFAYYIKEAANVYATPFERSAPRIAGFDVQLNICCFRR